MHAQSWVGGPVQMVIRKLYDSSCQVQHKRFITFERVFPVGSDFYNLKPIIIASFISLFIIVHYLIKGDHLMLKFVTIGYGGPADYERTPLPVREAAHTQDAKLRSEGVLMGIASAPVRVRNPDGIGTQTINGSFLASALPIDLPSSKLLIWPTLSKRFQKFLVLWPMMLLKFGRCKGAH
jgi:hypothetical protein